MAFGLDVIEFNDTTNRSVVARIPEDGSGSIPYGAQLIVHQNQEAVFFRDGQAMDVFGPGRHTLTSANVPLLTRLLTLPWKRSPFRAMVYFVGKQTFADQKWGTQQPITFRDKTFGVVRLRCYGRYSFRVSDSTVLINALVGTRGLYSTEDVTQHLRDVIVARLTDLLGTLQLDLVELPAKFDEIASATRSKVADEFGKYGMELVDFFISAISPPDEVQKMIDQRGNVAQDLRSFTASNAAQAVRAASDPPPGMVPGFARQAAGSAPAAERDRKTDDVRALIRSMAKASGWILGETSQNHWSLVVPVGSIRRQMIDVAFEETADSQDEFVCISSICGPANEQSAMQLLRQNAQMIHATFAIRSMPFGDMVVVEANHLADTADAMEISRAISSVAWQADQIEQQMFGDGDRF